MVAHLQGERTQQGLSNADEHKVVDIAGHPRAEVRETRHLHFKLHGGTDVGIGTLIARLRRDVGDCSCLMNWEQRLEVEVHIGLVHWHQAGRDEVSQSKGDDVYLVLDNLQVGHREGHAWRPLKVGVIQLDLVRLKAVPFIELMLLEGDEDGGASLLVVLITLESLHWEPSGLWYRLILR